MATKEDIIKGLHGAVASVLKRSEDTAAIVASLDAAQIQLEKAKAAVTTGLVDYDLLYKHMYGCRCTLESIYNGYPMVPAEKADTEKRAEFIKAWTAGEKKEMSADQFVEHAIAELELAAGEPREAAVKRALTVKATLLMWEDLPAGETPLAVTMIENSKPGAGRTEPPITKSTTPGEASFVGATSRLEALNKVADTNGSRPRPVAWGQDLSREVSRASRGKR